MKFIQWAAVIATLTSVGSAAAINTNVYKNRRDGGDVNLSDRDDAEVPYTRSYFYAGGSYVDNGAGIHSFQGQMYVERLRPVTGKVKKTPLILIHGQGQTGTNFLNKPDGGRGWASLFIQQGYEVYIVDQSFRGRSAWQPKLDDVLAPLPAPFPAETVQKRFTATKEYLLWPQAANHTQWPGTGKMGDPIFDAFYSSGVEYTNGDAEQQAAVQKAGAALLDRIGKPAIILGHSQGGAMPIVIADARPKLTKALIMLEPKGPPFREAVFSTNSARPWGIADVPLNYSPEVQDPKLDLAQQLYAATGTNLVDCVLQAEGPGKPAPRRLMNLADKPMLMVTAEASYHKPYDYCTTRFLKQAGCSKLKHIELGDIGIHGNGHMFFMEKNSQQIQKVVRDWMETL